jgi:hypothetical protein
MYGPSDPVPTSAKRLRPADIKVLGALGDRCATLVSYIPFASFPFATH